MIQCWIISIITPVFSVTWSFRNHSNMLICCSRSIYDYYQCWKQFLWKLIHYSQLHSFGNDLILHIFPGVFLTLSFILCACLFLCKNLLIKGQRWSVVVKLHRFMSSDLRVSSRSVLQMRCFDLEIVCVFVYFDWQTALSVYRHIPVSRVFVCLCERERRPEWRTVLHTEMLLWLLMIGIEFFWFLTWDSSIMLCAKALLTYDVWIQEGLWALKRAGASLEQHLRRRLHQDSVFMMNSSCFGSVLMDGLLWDFPAEYFSVCVDTSELI